MCASAPHLPKYGSPAPMNAISTGQRSQTMTRRGRARSGTNFLGKWKLEFNTQDPINMQKSKFRREEKPATSRVVCYLGPRIWDDEEKPTTVVNSVLSSKRPAKSMLGKHPLERCSRSAFSSFRPQLEKVLLDTRYVNLL